jgi:hypothetical protein
MQLTTTLLAAAILTASASSSAAVVYREIDDGELSSNGLTPTLITIGAGSNEIFGRMGGGAGGLDRDYFLVTVPAAMQLTALRLLPNTTVVGGSAFIAVQAGSQATVNPNAGSANGLLGWAHYRSSDVGTDILPKIGTGFGASGFSAPLGAGDYTFWLQETGGGTATYGLDLQLQPVPLPTALLGFSAALVLLRGRLRRSV